MKLVGNIKLVGKHGLSGVLEIAMWVLMVLAVAILLFLPRFVDTFMMPFNSNPDFWRPRYLVTLSVSGIMALLVLWQARGILHNVNTGTIFSMHTVRLMKGLGIEFLIMSVFYFATLFFGMTKFSIVLLGVVFLIAGLIVLVFSELFKQATAYKQENDMTI